MEEETMVDGKEETVVERSSKKLCINVHTVRRNLGCNVAESD